MIAIGVRELKQQTSELIRLVREEGKELQVTYRGDVVALVVPVARTTPLGDETAWESLDMLAAEIGACWPANITSVKAVREGRT